MANIRNNEGQRYIQRAYASILQHDFEAAIRLFEAAIELEPEHADFHYKLSVTCARSNKLAKALEHARMAASLEPKAEEYAFHVRTLEARQHCVEVERLLDPASSLERLYEAAWKLEQAVELDPLLVEGWMLLAHVRQRLGDYPLALHALQEAVKLEPHRQDVQELLALCRSMLSGQMNTKPRRRTPNHDNSKSNQSSSSRS